MAKHRARSQRSQSLVEFAIVAPLLLFLIFGIVDFGRVIYVYITLSQAVNEGVRVAIRSVRNARKSWRSSHQAATTRLRSK